MNQDFLNWVEELRRARQGKLLGRQILFFAQIDSTNTFARAQASRGAPEGLVVLADGQSKGRGRSGRTWISPAGVNLYMSIVLRPLIPLRKIPLITLVAGVAAAEALNDLSGLAVKIKWPNDLLIHGKKIAGLLAEGEGGNEFLILGIGVNVNWSRAEIPEELQQVATSLYAEKGIEFSRTLVAQELLEKIEEAYLLFLRAGFSQELREKWEELSVVKHRWVTIRFLDEEYVGQALGLDGEGALLIQNAQGEIRRFRAGEVSLRF